MCSRVKTYELVLSQGVHRIHSVETTAPRYVLDSIATLPFGWVGVVVFRLALDVGLALAL